MHSIVLIAALSATTGVFGGGGKHCGGGLRMHHARAASSCGAAPMAMSPCGGTMMAASPAPMGSMQSGPMGGMPATTKAMPMPSSSTLIPPAPTAPVAPPAPPAPPAPGQ